MKLEAVKNVVTSKVARQILIGKKNSPAILFAGGVVGVVATTLLACRATLRLEDVLDEAEDQHYEARKLQHKNYSELDRKRDHAIIYVRTAVKVTKLYAPAIGVGVISVAALTGSHVIITRRNVALTAAYSALERGFNEYRKRVVNDVGEDKDREYRFGVDTREILEETKEGPKVRKVKTVSGPSIYAKLFSRETSNSWSPQPEYNLLFLRCQQNYANDKLRARGHVFLNEVYDSLGLERTKEGAVTGWVLDNGDNYIDFGIFEGQDMDAMHEFMTSRQGAIWLDFNVDGIVYDLI